VSIPLVTGVLLADDHPIVRHGPGVEERFTAHGRAARVDQVAVGGGLEHVARRAGAQRLEEELLVLVHGEHEDPQLGLARGELARRLQARQPRHGHVEDDQIDVVGEQDAGGQGDAHVIS